MSQLPIGYTARPATKEDFKVLVDLFNGYWEALNGIVKFTEDDFNTIFSVPGFDIESSMLAVLSPEAEIIAGGLVTDISNPPVHPNVYGCVRADHQRKGIGTYLLQWGENRSKQAIERCPENTRVSMYLQISPSHQPSVQLFEKQQLTPIRYSWLMQTGLESAPSQPAWPQNIRVTTFTDFNDLEKLLKAVDEAFQDHWGHVDRSGDEERIARFKHQIENDVDFDPNLWFLALDGNEIAGVALCSCKLGTDRTIGMVETLGVRRPWRRQGLGLALLHHAFGEFYRREYKGVALGVDTQSLTGATRLYKKAGMEVIQELSVYEKELRAGEELSNQGSL